MQVAGLRSVLGAGRAEGVQHVCRRGAGRRLHHLRPQGVHDMFRAGCRPMQYLRPQGMHDMFRAGRRPMHHVRSEGMRMQDSLCRDLCPESLRVQIGSLHHRLCPGLQLLQRSGRSHPQPASARLSPQSSLERRSRPSRGAG